ncbi:hypothetical protein [Psychromonas sp. SP041]|uniref:hypothetical protein n=1 Tax=Psychromonas sp. SP041 TaxID=1365007 RepID=UPI000471E0C6|nr:hypothetical protein [Psychromonas sp. SP041]
MSSVFYSGWKSTLAVDSFPDSTVLGGAYGTPIGVSLVPSKGTIGTFGLYESHYEQVVTTIEKQNIYYDRFCINGNWTTLEPSEVIIDKTIEIIEVQAPDTSFGISHSKSGN